MKWLANAALGAALCAALAALAAPLPGDLAGLLAGSRVPAGELAVCVTDLASGRSLLEWNAARPMTPASIAKVVTASAALSLLGGAKTWKTGFYAKDPVRGGTLEGALYIKPEGDPMFAIERLWLVAEALRSAGIARIAGDLVVDRSAWHAPDTDFDGQSNRPYNVAPDPFMLGQRTVSFLFDPDPERGVARITAVPRLDGMAVPASVALSAGACQTPRVALKPDYANPLAPRFRGRYPLSCGRRYVHVAQLPMDEYIQRAFSAVWKSAGGRWTGRVRTGALPENARLLAESESDGLAKILYSVNKFSNNTMARSLFLALGGEAGSLDKSRSALASWLAAEGIPEGEIALDNGSGLSHSSRVTARALNRVLAVMDRSPWQAELAASLPVAGVDGTMRKRPLPCGSAHIKTGYLEGVRSVAGYVLSRSGRRYAVTAIVNGASAPAAKALLDRILAWTADR